MPKSKPSRRCSDIGDDLMRIRNRQKSPTRSPSPNKLGLPKLDSLRRRLSASDESSVSKGNGAIKKKPEVQINLFQQEEKKKQEILINLVQEDKPSKKHARRKSRDVAIAMLPGLMGSKRNRIAIIEDGNYPPEVRL